MVSPQTDIRSRLVNRGNVELFTVATDTPLPLRCPRSPLLLAALVDPAGGLPSAGEPWAQPNRRIVTQRITIKKLECLCPRHSFCSAWRGRICGPTRPARCTSMVA